MRTKVAMRSLSLRVIALPSRDSMSKPLFLHVGKAVSAGKSPGLGLRKPSVDFPLRSVAGKEAARKKRAALDSESRAAKRIPGRSRKHPESDAGNKTDAAQVEPINPTHPRSSEIPGHAEASIPPYRQIPLDPRHRGHVAVNQLPPMALNQTLL